MISNAVLTQSNPNKSKRMKEARSGIDVANIEEVLGAEDSAAWATLAVKGSR
jgi:hypothetical protein